MAVPIFVLGEGTSERVTRSRSRSVIGGLILIRSFVRSRLPLARSLGRSFVSDNELAELCVTLQSSVERRGFGTGGPPCVCTGYLLIVGFFYSYGVPLFNNVSIELAGECQEDSNTCKK